MRPDIVDAALASVSDDRPAIYFTPRGRPLTQATARRLAAGPGVVLLCALIPAYARYDAVVAEGEGEPSLIKSR